MNEQQMRRQAEDRIHRIPVGQPIEIILIEDVDEYTRKFQKNRAILNRILKVTDD